MNLSRQVFFLSLRAWLLIGNFLANALALFGLSVVVRGDDGMSLVLAGSALTIFFVAVLANPDKTEDVS
jgi:hypothetical protein